VRLARSTVYRHPLVTLLANPDKVNQLHVLKDSMLKVLVAVFVTLVKRVLLVLPQVLVRVQYVLLENFLL